MFELLRLAGFDVEARIAALKHDFERKAQHWIGELKDRARRAAWAAGLYAAAALLAVLALVIGLVWALRALADQYGLGIAAAIVIACLIVAAIALAVAGSRIARPRPVVPLYPIVTTLPPAPRPPPVAAPQVQAAGMATDAIYWFLRTFNVPVTGNWVADGLFRQLGGRTQGIAREGVVRAATVVRSGSRPAMLGVLGGIAVIGWLLVRKRH